VYDLGHSQRWRDMAAALSNQHPMGVMLFDSASELVGHTV
jgi:hypothetical protein